jgi:hypothetical protein
MSAQMSTAAVVPDQHQLQRDPLLLLLLQWLG